MALQDFDFEDFKGKKFNAYLKEHCKPTDVKKSKGGIIFTDYKMAGKKMPLVFIPFKKLQEADKIFKQIKKDKEHVLKKTAFVAVNVAKTESGEKEISLEIKKGGMSPDDIVSKGEKLFTGKMKMKMNVAGAAQAAGEAIASAASEATSEEGDAAETATEVNPQIQAAVDKIGQNLEKLKAAAGQLAQDKLQANIDKLQAALDKVETKVSNEEEGELVAELRDQLEALANGEAQASGSQLTPERRAKIQENIPKIKAVLDDILNELGMDANELV